MKERRTSVNASRLTMPGRPRSQGATCALEHRGPGRGGEGRSLHRLPGPLEPVQIRVRGLGVPVRIAVSVLPRSVFFLAETYLRMEDSSTRAGGVSGGSRWAAAMKRSTGRCIGSRSRCRTSVSRGQMLRRPTSRRGSFDRPAPRRCMPSLFGIASSSATSWLTCLPSAPPKSLSRRGPLCPQVRRRLRVARNR